jgi:hypothetical protein
MVQMRAMELIAALAEGKYLRLDRLSQQTYALLHLKGDQVSYQPCDRAMLATGWRPHRGE